MSIEDLFVAVMNETKNVIADHEQEAVFNEHMLGLRRLIGALFEAKIDDDRILMLTHKYYGISYDDAKHYLNIERNILSKCRALEDYLVNEENYLPNEAIDKINRLNTIQQLINKPELRKYTAKELYNYLIGNDLNS